MRPRPEERRPPPVMWICFAAVLTAALVAESTSVLDLARAWTRRRSAPAEAFGSGNTARALQRLDKIYPVPYEPAPRGSAATEQGRSPERRVASYSIDRTAPAEFPSTTILPTATYQDPSVAVFSLTLAAADAADLLQHPNERGIRWERPGYASFFDNGDLVFATGVGARVHGGKSRLESPTKSFRLYFRETYGADRFPGDVAFGRDDLLLSEIVLHNDLRVDGEGKPWQLINPLAYAIARKIGCLTPETRPVHFYLNGDFQGVYVLTERLGLDYLASRFGHEEFTAARTRRDPLSSWFEAGDLEAATPFLRPRWYQTQELDRLGRIIELENLTNWFVAIIFSATTDWYQGLMARDERSRRKRWFWVNWDLDHSFMEHRPTVRPPWERDMFRAVLDVDRRVRSVLLTRLLAESEDYRHAFLRRLVDVLNHELTPEFLETELARQRETAQLYGIKDRDFLDSMENFLQRRPAFVLQHASERLGLGEPRRITINSSVQTSLRIDGYTVAAEYTGTYFDGMTVRATIPRRHRPSFSHWLVDGVPHPDPGPDLALTVTGDTRLTAVFDAERSGN